MEKKELEDIHENKHSENHSHYVLLLKKTKIHSNMLWVRANMCEQCECPLECETNLLHMILFIFENVLLKLFI